MMVYISRYGAKAGDGDKIKWDVGEPAFFYPATRPGERYKPPVNVTIASNFAQHEAAPGKRCIEVIAGGKRLRVLAALVEPRGGFPPAPGFTDDEK